jgi:hypothetical protein
MTAEERAADIMTRCWNSGKADPPPPFAGLEAEIARAVREAEGAMRERAARLCVLRSCTWSGSDDRRSQDYREGIGDAASQLAAAIRALDAEIARAVKADREAMKERAVQAADEVFQRWLKAISKGTPPRERDVVFYREVVAADINALE